MITVWCYLVSVVSILVATGWTLVDSAPDGEFVVWVSGSCPGGPDLVCRLVWCALLNFDLNYCLVIAESCVLGRVVDVLSAVVDCVVVVLVGRIPVLNLLSRLPFLLVNCWLGQCVFDAVVDAAWVRVLVLEVVVALVVTMWLSRHSGCRPFLLQSCLRHLLTRFSVTSRRLLRNRTMITSDGQLVIGLLHSSACMTMMILQVNVSNEASSLMQAVSPSGVVEKSATFLSVKP